MPQLVEHERQADRSHRAGQDEEYVQVKRVEGHQPRAVGVEKELEVLQSHELAAPDALLEVVLFKSHDDVGQRRSRKIQLFNVICHPK